MRNWPYITAGAAALLMQVLVVRELLGAFSGLELEIGVTMGLWLGFTGLGSLAGSRVRGDSFAAALCICAALALPAITKARMMPSLLGLSAGEPPSLGQMLAATAIALGPLCVSLGALFPLGVRSIQERLRADNPSSLMYALESAGAAIAGVVFTFALARLLTAEQAALLCAAMLLAAAMGPRRSLAPVILSAAAVIGVFAAIVIYDSPDYLGARIVARAQSPYGQVIVTEGQGQRNVYSSGHLMFSTPDRKTAQLMAHLPLLFMDSPPARVLAIGGSPEMMAEILRHGPPSLIRYAEPDPAMLKAWLNDLPPAASGNPAIEAVVADPRAIMKSSERYDAILISLPPPSTAALNRFYTVEFFREARAALNEGGVLALWLRSSGAYAGRTLRAANGPVYASLREAFPHVALSAPEYGLAIASASPLDSNPHVLEARLGRIGPSDDDFIAPHVIEDAFEQARASMYAVTLGRHSVLNTDARPVSYMHQLELWADMYDSAFIRFALANALLVSAVLLAAIICLSAWVLVVKRGARSLAIGTTGLWSMGYTLVLMLWYQSKYGYIYERFALMSAVFMAGIPLGARLAGAIRRMAVADILMAGLALATPALAGHEAVYYLLNALAGVLVGAQFTLGSGMFSTGHAERGGAALYAAELAGALAGALFVTAMLVPALGLGATLLFLTAVKVISSATIFKSHENKH